MGYPTNIDLTNKQKGPSVVIIELDREHKLEFSISSVIQRKVKEDLLTPSQFELLNKFVDYKGKEFKKNLYKTYEELMKNLDSYIYSANFSSTQPLPYHIMQPLFSMFDIEEVYRFLRDVYKLKIPITLPEEFNPDIERDGKGTREQTYTKDDYLQLASLVVVIKATFFALSQYSLVTGECFGKPNKIYVLFGFYSKYPKFFRSEPMEKLIQFTDKLVNDPKMSMDDHYIRILDKLISSDEMVLYIVSQIVIQKLSISTIVNDTSDSNVINAMFKSVNNKLESQGAIDKVIRCKTNLIDQDSSTGEKESFIESHRIVSDITKGDQVLVNVMMESIPRILKQLSPIQYELVTRPLLVNGKTYTLEDVREYVKAFVNKPLSLHSIKFLESIFKGIMDPRWMQYMELEQVLNFIAIGFCYMWNLGYHKLAMLLVSTTEENESDFVTINSSSNKSRLTQEIISKLERIYPQTKCTTKNSQEGELAIKRWIEEIGNSYFTYNWVSVLPLDFSVEVFQKEEAVVPVPEDLKLQIANYLLTVEEQVYRNFIHTENKGE